MEKIQVKEFDCKTGEEIIRDATDAEITQMKLDAEFAAAKKAEEQAQIAAEEAAKQQAFNDAVATAVAAALANR